MVANYMQKGLCIEWRIQEVKRRKKGLTLHVLGANHKTDRNPGKSVSKPIDRNINRNFWKPKRTGWVSKLLASFGCIIITKFRKKILQVMREQMAFQVPLLYGENQKHHTWRIKLCWRFLRRSLHYSGRPYLMITVEIDNKG